MCNPSFAKIGSAICEGGHDGLITGVDLKNPVKKWHDGIVVFMCVPSSVVAFLRKRPLGNPSCFIFDQDSANGGGRNGVLRHGDGSI